MGAIIDIAEIEDITVKELKISAIGKEGQLTQVIMSEPNSGSDLATVIGPLDDVEKRVHLLCSDIGVDDNKSQHRHVIGPKCNANADVETIAEIEELELVPITAEVAVPYEFHRFIIGQEGIGVVDAEAAKDAILKASFFIEEYFED